MFLFLSDVKMKVLKNTKMLASLAQERANKEGGLSLKTAFHSQQGSKWQPWRWSYKMALIKIAWYVIVD